MMVDVSMVVDCNIVLIERAAENIQGRRDLLEHVYFHKLMLHCQGYENSIRISLSFDGIQDRVHLQNFLNKKI
jgi:hypothetical protein